jgi:AAA ATPase domain
MLDSHLPAAGFLDRASERDVLERLVAGVRAGESRVLVLRGEAGVGKTAVLGLLSTAAEGCRVARAAGVESEMELAFAGLHALCAVPQGRSVRSHGQKLCSLGVSSQANEAPEDNQPTVRAPVGL